VSGPSSIEWTDATWNPVRGCSRVSEGCRHCYAERIAGRFSGPGKPYEGIARRGKGAGGGGGARWTGEVRLVNKHLADPLRWRKPRRVFVNSMSDLFHEKLGGEDIARVFAIMAQAQQHTFQVLTKRPSKMQEVVTDHAFRNEIGSLVGTYIVSTWPLPNVWLGVSVEDQATADERIPLLLDTPAAVRFVSYEPALGPVKLCRGCPGCPNDCGWMPHTNGGIHWVIAGSESGPSARPAEIDWFRSIRDQCAAAGIPFFFKQWKQPLAKLVSLPHLDGRQHVEWPR
jgi:protein gp37